MKGLMPHPETVSAVARSARRLFGWPTPQPDTQRCRATCPFWVDGIDGELSCTLPATHDGPHHHTEEDGSWCGVATWFEV